MPDSNNTMTGPERYAQWKAKISQCKDRRVLWEAKVATCMHFASGNHKVWWDDKGMMRKKEVAGNEVFRPVNYFPSALSVLSARMVASDLRWNPSKSELTDVTDEEVEAADAALQDLWGGDEFGDFSVKQEMKIVVRHGFLQSGRLVYFRFDHDADMPVMESFSLWDVYSDSPAKIKDKQWIAIACPKSVEWVKNNEEFSKGVRSEVDADAKLAESGLHQQYLQSELGTGSTKTSDTVMLYYTFEVVYGEIPKSLQEDDYDDSAEEDAPPDEDELTEEEILDSKKDKKQKKYIRYEVVCSNGVLLEGAIDYPRLSAIFDQYKPVEDGMFYGTPPCYDWIDPSKSIDKTNSNIESYMDTFLHGKWILRSRKVTVPVSGREGQKIIDETGNSVQQLQLQPLPQTHFQYKQDAERHFERISGVHNVSLGGQTGSVEAGVAIAQIMAADEQNTSDPVDNYKMFLQRCGKKLLRQMSDNWSDTRTLYRYDSKEMQQVPVKVIGEKFYNPEEGAQAGSVRIRPFKHLDVQIEIGVFWKKSEKRNQVIELLKTGWSPGGNPIMDRVILSSFEIGVGREIVRELKNLQNPHAYIVEGKAMLVASGEQVPVEVDDPHEFYWNFFAQKSKEALQGGDQRSATLLNAQAQQHAILMQQGMGASGSPNAPETLEDLEALQGASGGLGGLPGQRTIVKA
jgi:hypothetical protein